MRTYTVTLEFTTRFCMQLDAETEKEAVAKASYVLWHETAHRPIHNSNVRVVGVNWEEKDAN